MKLTQKILVQQQLNIPQKEEEKSVSKYKIPDKGDKYRLMETLIFFAGCLSHEIIEKKIFEH